MIIQGVAGAQNLFEDVARFGGPDEGLGGGVRAVYVVVEGGDELQHAAEDAAPQPVDGAVPSRPPQELLVGVK